jgi:hypothetical protein
MPTWKDIKGYEGLYQVSDMGEVRSLNRVVMHKPYNKETPAKINGKTLKKSIDKNGYFKVVLCKNGITQTIRVSRLVAENFLDNPNDEPTVNHKDLNVKNDNIKNLEWAGYIYQCNHKTNNVFLEYKGEILTVTEVWRKYAKDKMNRTTFKERIRKGWDVQQAIDTEVMRYAYAK